MIKYKKTQTTVSYIQYHFVFTPRYRRKLFLRSDVESRFIQMVQEVCQEFEFELLAIGCGEDFVHLHLDSPPLFSPADIMAKIKTQTSKRIREEFAHLQHLPSLWTREYFVTSEKEISRKTIDEYVAGRKTRC